MKKQIPLLQITSKIGSGATPHGGSNVYLKKGISFIRSQNVQDMHFSENGLVFLNQEQAKNLNGVSVKSGDILLNITGDSIARSCIVPDEILPARVNQHVAIIRCKNKQDAEYIGYYIQYLKPHLLQICKVGGTRNALTKDVISKLNVHLLDDRCKRATILTSINKKIELNNRINAELEAMAKTLYDYWFVQFDFPDEKGRPYKSSGGKMVYNKVLKRKIPEGWTVNSMGDWVADDKTGDWGKDIAEGNYSLPVDCIRGADINGINGNDRLKPPLRYILQKNAQKILSPLDLIVEISGGSPVQSTGRLAYLIDETLDRFEHSLICSNFCKAITLKNRCYFFNFAYQWKFIYDHGILFGWEGKTSGIKNLLFDSFATKYKVCMPPEKIAQNFYECIYPLEKEKQKMLKENEKLSSLRDWLLPMLMNGQVKVG
jgi:type I restriction enzyme, S subunit